MNDYVDYVRNVVEYIKSKTEFEKYHWKDIVGGIIALIYTALNNNEQQWKYK